MLRNGTSTHCSHSGKRWHERDAALRRQEAVQAVATQVGDDYHAVYGLRIEPHIQGRLFLTGEVTNTQRNGKPLGTWVTRVPDDAIAYEGADGVMHMPDEETVFVPAYGYKATCSCGAGVILKLEEVDGYETTTSPRFDCTGASVGDRIRIHKEPSGSPAWLPMCSEEERGRENTRRYQVALAQLEADIEATGERELRGLLRDMVKATKRKALEIKRAGKPKRSYKPRNKVVLPDRLQEGEKDVFTAINELKEQT